MRGPWTTTTRSCARKLVAQALCWLRRGVRRTWRAAAETAREGRAFMPQFPPGASSTENSCPGALCWRRATHSAQQQHSAHAQEHSAPATALSTRTALSSAHYSRAKHSAHALDVGTAYAAALHRPTILATARPQVYCDSRRRRLLLQRHRGAGAPLPDARPPPARLLFAARFSSDRRIATCLEAWAADRLGAHVASDRPIAAGVAHDGTL